MDKSLIILVGTKGFEPLTSTVSDRNPLKTGGNRK